MLQTITPNGASNGAVHRAERVSERVGVAPDAVERLPFDLSALDSDGVFVNVDAQGFGLLDRRMWRTTWGQRCAV